MKKNGLTKLTMRLLPNFARDTWVNLVAKVRYETNGDVSACQAIVYLEMPDQVEEEARKYIADIRGLKDSIHWDEYHIKLLERMANQLTGLRGQLLIMQQAQDARAEISETQSEVAGTEQQVEIAERQQAAQVDAGMVEERAREMYEAYRFYHKDSRMYPWRDQPYEPTKQHWRDKARAAIAALEADQPAPERQGGVFGYVGFREQTTMTQRGYAQVLSRQLPELGVVMPVYLNRIAPTGVIAEVEMWANAPGGSEPAYDAARRHVREMLAGAPVMNPRRPE